MASVVVEMPLTDGPPRFGINMLRIAQLIVFIVLIATVPNGLPLICGMIVAFIGSSILQRRYCQNLQIKVDEFHVTADQYIQDGKTNTLRMKIHHWHWLCFVGFAGDVYDAWGRIYAAENQSQKALSYFQRALRAGSANRNNEILIRMVKLYWSLDDEKTSDRLAAQLLQHNPHDLFLRHRLELILGDERIAQLAP